jgi:hypothetical protein
MNLHPKAYTLNPKHNLEVLPPSETLDLYHNRSLYSLEPYR